MGKTIKYLIAIATLPLTLGFSRAFYGQLSDVSYVGPRLHLVLWGIIIYMLMHVLFHKPIYIYTLGHEAIHILATWMCGGHVTNVNISRSGGSVSTSKTNFFIELSPYFIPTYTVLLIFLMPVVRYKLSNPQFLAGYIFLLGFTLGMHLIMTAEVLKIRQPDLMKSGYPFSVTLIFIGNLIIVFLILSGFTRDLSFKAYFLKSVEYARDMYLAFFSRFF